MRVAVLFSGGKDSTQAVKWCFDKGYNVTALIAIKPKNTEAYLWHYATVEWSLLSAEAMGLPLILAKCYRKNPKDEAKELEKILKRIKIDALVLGGVGLQKTQIKEIEKVAKKYKIKVLVPYKGYSSEELVKEEIDSGFDIIITQVASDGLGPEWLGKRLDKSSFEELKELSQKFGFDLDFEGGYADTFVCDGPIFKKRIEFLNVQKVWDNKTSSGYLEVSDAQLVLK
ncbi:MAG: diphthine--ammonia ligase [Candidatus Aenigmarchaeota archaeon]|nr:diphthine--ammonia ligase [Candidatus Aenigmarchaeota archaeon]